MPGWPLRRFAVRARKRVEVVRVDRAPDLQDVSLNGRPLEWGPPLTAEHDLITQMANGDEYPPLAGVRGYPRLDNGAWRPEQVEFLSQMSGLPAVTVTGRTAEEAVAGWQALTDRGRPVTTGSKEGVEGNPYGVLSYRDYGHSYGVLKVCHGTQAEAGAEADRLHALIRATAGRSEPPAHVPQPAPRNPDDARWPSAGPSHRQHWVIFDNPWGYYQPKPVPLDQVDSLFHVDAATIGTPEEIRNLPRTLPSREESVVWGRPPPRPKS